MTQPSVSVPAFDVANDKPFGPARIEHRSASAELQELGTYFMVFDSEGFADPWTLQYEETIYVIDGECRLVVHEEGAERAVTAAPGELVVLRKGATVQYGGTVGTRLLLSIAPVDWRTRSS